MTNENDKSNKNYVTQVELYKHTQKMHDKLDDKIDEIDDKHTERNHELKILITTMTETNKSIENNTSRTAESVEKLSSELKQSHSETSNKVSDLSYRTKKIEDDKAGRITIMVALIGGGLTLLGVILKPFIESIFM
ncbi:hypothetical protein [Corticicoccus populi]|uniref:Uncharacterized protein n=1 Tax=Corticicoccus populi TaxID=1812821 RepID=A0ABW5WRV7_9STAP